MSRTKYPRSGGRAFPVAASQYCAKSRRWIHAESQGMSLRDYFAGQAIAGLLARPSGEMPAEIAASFAYHFADAMILLHKKEDAP